MASLILTVVKNSRNLSKTGGKAHVTAAPPDCNCISCAIFTFFLVSSIYFQYYLPGGHLEVIGLKIIFKKILKMAPYEIVMIRHGESTWNQENKFCGW